MSRRTFTEDFKAEAVALVRSSGKSIYVARDLDLTEAALREWVRKAEGDQPRNEWPLDIDERARLRRLEEESRILRMERDFLKKSGGLLRERDEVKFDFIEAEKANFPVGFLCRPLGVSRSGLYSSRSREQSNRAKDEASFVEQVKAVHADSRGTYGSPRVSVALKKRGRGTSRMRVARVMREQGLVARSKKRFRRTTDSNHAFPIADNVLDRHVTANAPNKAWVTDITYLWTREGWLYVAVVVDLYSRTVVGWAMSERIDRRLCLAALDMAEKARRPAPGLIHHSDRGSPYASNDYRSALLEHGMVCSMSRKGDCWDNAVAESFWSTLKAALGHDTDFPTRAVARHADFEYIEVFYNRRRIHASLGFDTPPKRKLFTSQRCRRHNPTVHEIGSTPILCGGSKR